MATTSVSSDVKGFELADLGKKRIEWANQLIKALQIIRLRAWPAIRITAPRKPHLTHGSTRSGKRSGKKQADGKAYYGNASIVGADRVVFNIKGNDYRLVTAIDYRRGIVFIKWLGSHTDYDKIDVRTVQYDH